MTKDFAFNVGDVVATKLHLDELRYFLDTTQLQMRPDSMRIVERISVECDGGTQLFYGCEARDGLMHRHAEDGLIRAESLWDAWIDGIKKQEAKKNLSTV
jgi:hypothetical protein